MKKQYRFANIILTAALVAFLAGCQTYAGAGLGGAALGAGIGAIIGNQSGNQGEGALIGAVIGAAGSLAIHDAKARRSKDGETTAREYGHKPQQGEMLTFEEAHIDPEAVRRGDMVEAFIQYALLGAEDGVQVTETRELRHEGNLIAQISSKTYSRYNGTWESSQQVRISRHLERGRYTIVQTVATARSTISGVSSFTIR